MQNFINKLIIILYKTLKFFLKSSNPMLYAKFEGYTLYFYVKSQDSPIKLYNNMYNAYFHG